MSTITHRELVDRLHDDLQRAGIADMPTDAEMDYAIQGALENFATREGLPVPAGVEYGGYVWECIDADVLSSLEFDYDVVRSVAP